MTAIATRGYLSDSPSFRENRSIAFWKPGPFEALTSTDDRIAVLTATGNGAHTGKNQEKQAKT